MSSRPLSPHLSIYRFAYTMALSILHRATGIFLSLGLLLLVAMLVALAQGEGAWQQFLGFARSWPVKLWLVLLLVAFSYHFANGIRHLVWDTGRGLERHQARASARLVLVFTVLASAALVYLFFFTGGTP
jgi:succinate dehydrogenase / fumarate reductase cytochrome b subunit